MAKQYDVIVIGTGAGANVASVASSRGMKVALIDEGPFGGTCLNRGCVPSKMLIGSADVAELISRAKEFGLGAKLTKVDFKGIVKWVTESVDGWSAGHRKASEEDEHLDVYAEHAEFIAERTLRVGEQEITGDKVFIAAGARSALPPVEGLRDVPFITSKEALRLEQQPRRLTILGGGYIAAELGHFYGSLGTEVTIVQRNPFLVPNEDAEVAAKFTELFSKKYAVFVNHTATKVRHRGGTFTLTVESKDGDLRELRSDQLLVAAGIRPNSDRLKVAAAGVETDERGAIVVDDYLATSAKNVWAFGDIILRHPLRHAANWEAGYAARNGLAGMREAVDYTAMPHAVFTSPQIAGVGATEQELRQRGQPYAVGYGYYKDITMGDAHREQDGFVKLLTAEDQETVLGCHIIGPEASTLIQEVVLLMKTTGKVSTLKRSIHIHPAMPEVVSKAFSRIEPRE